MTNEPILAPDPSVGATQSLRRGLLGRCPACGHGRLFGRFLKVVDHCDACGEPMHHHRADDFPPYIVMFLVGHVIVWGILQAEMRFEAPLLLHLLLWPILAILLSVLLLQPVKGAVVGLQYGLGMHGFAAAGRRDRRKTWGPQGERDARTGHHRSTDLHRS
jgi:uncharacterized protein (DUF983 family)